ncbi:MAG: ComEC/Rec2 family competence protein [Proteobacteria bacterium]|nr:ComEC/Rec2 family competence protein [Pseudomonadota bacterium]
MVLFTHRYRLLSPVFFLVLLLLPSLFYFSDFPLWWIYQTGLQFLVCLVGLAVPYWRNFAAIATVLVLYFNVGWFQIDPEIPNSCKKQIDHFSGISKYSSYRTSPVLDLIKIEIRCRGESKRWPSARILLPKDRKRGFGWFRTGDRILLKKISIAEMKPWALRVEPNRRFRIINLSRQGEVLRRPPLLLYIQNKARYYLGEFPSAIYRALITADRTDLTPDWKKRIQDLGISHVFAISGMHIGIIYLWISLFLRAVLSFPVSWIERGYGLAVIDFINVVLIYFFLDIIGMPISARRSLTMLTWWIVVRHFLPWQPLGFILLGTAALILLEQPYAIGQISFQLSFVSVAGILAVVAFLPRNRLGDSLWRRLFKAGCSTLIVSFWLFLFTFPLVDRIAPFHSVASAVNNVVHILYLSCLFLPVVLTSLAITILGYPFGGVVGEFYLYSVVNFLSKLWEWLLLWNAGWNRLFLWRLEREWDAPSIIIYWSVLLSIPILISRLMRGLRKEMMAQQK